MSVGRRELPEVRARSRQKRTVRRETTSSPGTSVVGPSYKGLSVRMLVVSCPGLASAGHDRWWSERESNDLRRRGREKKALSGHAGTGSEHRTSRHSISPTTATPHRLLPTSDHLSSPSLRSLLLSSPKSLNTITRHAKTMRTLNARCECPRRSTLFRLALEA